LAPSKDRFEADLKLLEKAVQTLTDALGHSYDDMVRDAVIQRFEYVFELAWKTIQAAATYAGTPCNSPREAIRSANKMGWLSDSDAWLEAMEARNKTSHTYNETIANDVYEVAKRFPKLIGTLIAALKKV
jgi:nucleotidyltransferase substrate binding protein (TIGR01987 family)